MRLHQLWAFVKLTRPFFLLGGALVYGLGLTIAAWQGAVIDAGRALLGQWLVTSIQLMAHYLNEYYDIEVDRLAGPSRTRFTGGSGVLPSGALPHEVARTAAIVCAISGVIAAIIATIQIPVIGFIGLISLLGSWFYSAPPLSLMGSGFGELTTSILVALLVPLTGYAMQTGRLAPIVFQACLPLVVIHLAMILTFEFPDRIVDAQIDKKTLTVRFGLKRIAQLHTILIVGAFGLIALLPASPATRFAWLAIPLAVWQIISAAQNSRRERGNWERLSFGAIGLFALTSGLSLIGFVAT
jgi:1,4-dihydroxy-2-naphthoate octaprenyltransferase